MSCKNFRNPVKVGTVCFLSVLFKNQQEIPEIHNQLGHFPLSVKHQLLNHYPSQVLHRGKNILATMYFSAYLAKKLCNISLCFLDVLGLGLKVIRVNRILIIKLIRFSQAPVDTNIQQ